MRKRGNVVLLCEREAASLKLYNLAQGMDADVPEYYVHLETTEMMEI